MSVLRRHSRPLRPPVGVSGHASVLRHLPASGEPALLAEVLAAFHSPGTALVVGVTGSVAAGKSTLCQAVAEHLGSSLRVEIIATDGFLLSNDVLAARGLSLKKGYPETYDHDLLSDVLQRCRWGEVCVPGYSHATYDRAPELDRTIASADVVLVEGLGLSLSPQQRATADLLDLLIYIDADEAALEDWYVKRFLDHWRAAETDPGSFYARFRSLSEADTAAFARQVWTAINLPNLREHVHPLKQEADILVEKSADHGLHLSLTELGQGRLAASSTSFPT